MHKNETVCKGCFILGNGCGKCSRCLSQRELMVSAQQVFNLTGKMPTLLNAELADAQAEIARLRGALEACSEALAIAAPFADGCPSEDAIKIIVGQACARAVLK